MDATTPTTPAPRRSAASRPAPPGNPSGGIGARPLSPSRANDFLSCPLKYRYRTIDKLPEPPSSAAARGSLVHSALEAMFGLDRAERTLTTVGEMLPELWQQMLTSRPELAHLPEVADVDGWLASAGTLLRTYFRMEDPTRFDPQASELFVEVTLPGGVPTRGYLDRLDASPEGLLRIVDYKTGKTPRQAYADSALFQLKFYALMLFRLRGVVVTRLKLLYLADGGTIEFSPDESGLLAFERTVVSLWTSIRAATESGVFPPRRSALCSWCAFQPYCPEFGGSVLPYPPADAPHEQ